MAPISQPTLGLINTPFIPPKPQRQIHQKQFPNSNSKLNTQSKQPKSKQPKFNSS